MIRFENLVSGGSRGSWPLAMHVWGMVFFARQKSQPRNRSTLRERIRPRDRYQRTGKAGKIIFYSWILAMYLQSVPETLLDIYRSQIVLFAFASSTGRRIRKLVWVTAEDASEKKECFACSLHLKEQNSGNEMLQKQNSPV